MKIILKKGNGVPTNNNLVKGELALNLADNKLHTITSNGTVLSIGVPSITFIKYDIPSSFEDGVFDGTNVVITDISPVNEYGNIGNHDFTGTYIPFGNYVLLNQDSISAHLIHKDSGYFPSDIGLDNMIAYRSGNNILAPVTKTVDSELVLDGYYLINSDNTSTDLDFYTVSVGKWDIVNSNWSSTRCLLNSETIKW